MYIWEKLKRKIISRGSNKVSTNLYLREVDVHSANLYLEILNILIINSNTYRIVIHFDENGHSTAFLKFVFSGLVKYHGISLCNKMIEFKTDIENDIRIDEVKNIMINANKSLTLP